MLDVFVDEACSAFLTRKDRITCIGVACLFFGGWSDMTIDVVSRCQQGKAFGVVGLGVLRFLSVGIVFEECVG